jgi:hypothetical protein
MKTISVFYSGSNEPSGIKVVAVLANGGMENGDVPEVSKN